MSKKSVQQDPAISSVQKIITFGMLFFIGYLFFTQDRHTQQQLPPVAEKIIEETKIAEPVKVKITNTESGDISFSDLSKGKVLIGKWEIELDEPESEINK